MRKLFHDYHKNKTKEQVVIERSEKSLDDYLTDKNQVKILRTAVTQGLCNIGIQIDFDYDITVGLDLLGMMMNHYQGDTPMMIDCSLELLSEMNSFVTFPLGEIFEKPVVMLNLKYLVKDPNYMLDSDTLDEVCRQVAKAHYMRQFAKRIDKTSIFGGKPFPKGFFFWSEYQASYIGNITRLMMNREIGMHSLGADVYYVTNEKKSLLSSAVIRDNKLDRALHLATYLGNVAAWNEMSSNIKNREREFMYEDLMFTQSMIHTYYALRNAKECVLEMEKFTEMDHVEIGRFLSGDLQIEKLYQLAG